jgi:hypothetical protein
MPTIAEIRKMLDECPNHKLEITQHNWTGGDDHYDEDVTIECKECGYKSTLRKIKEEI